MTEDQTPLTPIPSMNPIPVTDRDRGTISVIVNDNADSIRVGTPAKGGEFKVYGNADKIEDFKRKIDNMVELRKYAQAKIQVDV